MCNEINGRTKRIEMLVCDYIVERIDGDYAYLNQLANPDAEEKCVARALLPDSINVGTKLAYEMMQYEIIE